MFPVTGVSPRIALQSSALPCTVQRAPRGSTICPSSRDLSNLFGATLGPLQSFGLRAQRYTQAAIGLSGSFSGEFLPHTAQPHRPMEGRLSCLADPFPA